MQLVKRTEETSDGRVQPTSGGFVGWLIAVLAQWRVHGWKLRGAERQKRMQLLETLPLGGRRQLLLVSCGGQEFLVGAGPDSISSLLRVTCEPSDADVGAPLRSMETRA